MTTDVDTTVDPSETTAPKLDSPNFQMKPPGVVGCTLAAPPGTSIQGKTGLGPFTADRAYFGVVGLGDDIWSPVLVFLAPGADPDGAVASFEPHTDPYDQWVGEWPCAGQHADKSMYDTAVVTLKITGLVGNWDAADPADPPRVVGSIVGDLVGDFDAVYCDKTDDVIIPE